MHRLLSGKAGWLALLLCGASWFATVVVSADEPAAEFLRGLREHGYYDMALEYLEQMRSSPLAPADFKESILYETGATLVAAAAKQRDVPTRLKQLDEAGDTLRRFISQAAEHPKVPAAKSELGSILLQRAQINVDLAQKPGADRAALLAQARRSYEEAFQVFEQSHRELNDRVTKMVTIDPKDKQAAELRERLKRARREAQMLAAAVKEEMAETVGRDSEEYRTLLAEAAKLYEQIAERYRDMLAGFYARMYQGRCQQKLGNYRPALTLYGEILSQTENADDFRHLKTKTLLLALECWAQSKPPLNAEAVATVGPWWDAARGSEQKTDDWLALRLGLAKAQWALAEELLAANPKDAQARRLQADARKHAAAVARERTGVQEEARKLVVAWGGKVSPAAEQPAELRTFADARQAGQDALGQMQTAQLVLKTVPERLQAERDEAARAELQKQLDEAKRKAAMAAADSQRLFRQALSLAGRDTDLEDLNRVRYYLCFLYYHNQEYYEAAVIGEFVARRYPDSPLARECAKIVLAAFTQLYSQAPASDREFESDRIARIAKYITEKWPDQPEAVDARSTLIQFLVKTGDVSAAEKCLSEIPADSPRRGDAEIKTGQAMWSAYRKGMQELRRWETNEEPLPAGVDLGAKKAALEQLKGRAQKVLADGMTRVQRSGDATEAVATAALALAQIYVDTGQADRAVRLLEDRNIGPLTLIEAKDAAAAREGFAAEAYRTGLRAYVSSLGSAAEPRAVIEKAQALMDAMKGAIDPQQLTAIYVALARDLEHQMRLASPETRQVLSKGFETFLTQLRSSATEFSVLNWVAETFFSIAAGFDTGGLNPTADALKYYQEAVDTYDAILSNVQLEDPNLRLQVQLRKAAAKRRLAKFTEARDIYRDILRSDNMRLNVQIEAAKMYQEWAAYPDKAALYDKAMGGSDPNPKTQRNIIWGWGRLAVTVARHPHLRNVFHEARYNLAACRYSQARAETNATRQQELFERAKQDILKTQQLFHVGPEWLEWRPRYEALLREIQKASGTQPTGLPPDPKDEPAATKPTAAKTIGQ
jgi:tetratricopeptide (TPR) repeat protein